MPRRSREPLTPDQARARALRALGRREHSARELEAKLAAQGFEEAAPKVVEELQRAGWQSDERYAELLVRSRVAQGYGRLRIEAELASRGVADAAIRAALAQAQCDWAALAAEIRTRKFGAGPQSLSERQKQYRFLAGRGFEAQQIDFALKQAPQDGPES